MLDVIIQGESFHLKRENKQIFVNDKQLECDVAKISDHKFHVLLNGKGYMCEIMSRDGRSMVLSVNGNQIELETQTEMDLLLKSMGLEDALSSKAKDLQAPMPGLVLDLYIEVGQEVKPGDKLILLEAMKMENVIKAEGEGTVKEILVEKGINVEKGAVLIAFE